MRNYTMIQTIIILFIYVLFKSEYAYARVYNIIIRVSACVRECMCVCVSARFWVYIYFNFLQFYDEQLNLK